MELNGLPPLDYCIKCGADTGVYPAARSGYVSLPCGCHITIEDCIRLVPDRVKATMGELLPFLKEGNDG